MVTKKATANKTVISLNNDDIPAQIETLKADVARLTQTLKTQTKATVSQKTTAAKDYASEKSDAAKVRYDELTTKAEASIKENPLTSIAIAIGAGIVLGALTRR